MRTIVRRIGSSLGVVLPKALLDGWRVGEGDHLKVSEFGVRPQQRRASSQQLLDKRKRQLAVAVVREFPPLQIRSQSLANLHRWKSQGTWLPVYDEWQRILEHSSDGTLFAAMLGRDEEANRLRQSMPFVGLLSAEQVKTIYEETGD
ncbi:MAG: hypothetical protein JSR66_30115 [Proteobacteria bacterium]|nr:hypothetical protein [Pseudomonadota bacterium]